MNVCIPLKTPSTEKNFLQLQLAEHFGKAGCYVVIDTETQEFIGECETLKPCTGVCHCSIPDLSQHNIEALAGPSMGSRLSLVVRKSELKYFQVSASTVVELLVALTRTDCVETPVYLETCSSR